MLHVLIYSSEPVPYVDPRVAAVRNPWAHFLFCRKYADSRRGGCHYWYPSESAALCRDWRSLRSSFREPVDKSPSACGIQIWALLGSACDWSCSATKKLWLEFLLSAPRRLSGGKLQSKKYSILIRKKESDLNAFLSTVTSFVWLSLVQLWFWFSPALILIQSIFDPGLVFVLF